MAEIREQSIVIITHNPNCEFGFSKVSKAIIDDMLDTLKCTPDNIKIIDTLKTKLGEDTYRGIPIFQTDKPQQYPKDRITKVIQETKPNLVLTFGDPWDICFVSPLATSQMFYWIHYMPVEYQHIESKFPIPDGYVSMAALMNTIDMIIAYSKFGQAEIQSVVNKPVSYIYHGYDPKEYYVMPDSEKLSKSAISFGLDDNSFLVSTVAANGFRKGIDLMFIAFRKFLDSIPTEERSKCFFYLHTNIEGTGGWRIKDLAKMTGIEANVKVNEQVKSYGKFISTEQLRTIYNVSDLYINMSRGEGFGLPILEAMACGCRVMYPDYATPPEFANDLKIPIAAKEIRINVHSYSAIANVDKAAREMRKLYYEIKNSPEKHRKIKKENAKRALQYTWENTITAWRQVFLSTESLPVKEKKLRMVKV